MYLRNFTLNQCHCDISFNQRDYFLISKMRCEKRVIQLYKWFFFLECSCVRTYVGMTERLSQFQQRKVCKAINFYQNKRHQSLECSLKRVDTNTLFIRIIYFWIPFVSKIDPNPNIYPLLYRLLSPSTHYSDVYDNTFRNCINNYHVHPLMKHVISPKIHNTANARQLDQAEVSTCSNLDYLLAEYLSYRRHR